MLTYSGISSNAQNLVYYIKEEILNYKIKFNSDMPIQLILDKMANFLQNFTVKPNLRPIGCNFLIGDISNNGEDNENFEYQKIVILLLIRKGEEQDYFC